MRHFVLAEHLEKYLALEREQTAICGEAIQNAPAGQRDLYEEATSQLANSRANVVDGSTLPDRSISDGLAGFQGDSADGLTNPAMREGDRTTLAGAPSQSKNVTVSGTGDTVPQRVAP